MTQVLTASPAARGPLQVRVWHALASLGVAAVVSELVWRLQSGVGSPLRAAIFVAIAVCVGNLFRQLALGPGRTRGLAECFAAGFVAASMLYLVLRALHAPAWVITVALLGLAAWGAQRAEWRSMLMRRLDVLGALGVAFSVWIVAYAEWLMDGPQLGQQHPSIFLWIDTPLWLNLSHGLERAVPPRELLFQGGHLNTQWGAGLLPLWIRHTTGLPLHSAYAASVVSCGVGFGLLLRTLAQSLFRPERVGRLLLLRVAPLLGALWFQCWVHSFPSVVGGVLMLYGLSEFQRATRWSSLALLLPLTLLLMLTSEVYYVAFLYGALVLAAWRLYARRDWRPLLFLALSFVAVRLCERPLVHRDQGVRWAAFSERLNLSGVWYVSAIEHVMPPYGVAAIDLFVGTLAVVTILLCWRRRQEASVLIGSTLVLLGMTAITTAVHPQFTPALSADEDHWLLVDMYNFLRLGGQLALLALFAWALVAMARAPRVRRYPGFAAALLMMLAVRESEDHYNRIAQPAPENPPVDDPIVQLLPRIDPMQSLVAAPLGGGVENPRWAAIQGHQFFCLRRGRWTPAYANYQQVIAKQDAIFAAPDLGAMQLLARSEGITHVIVDKQQPPPWAGQRRPEVESDRYAVYELEATRAR